MSESTAVLRGARTNRAARDLVVELAARAGIVVNGPGPADIQVHDERFYERVVRDRELGIGESYQEGWWSAERPDELLARVLAADLRSHIKPSRQLLLAGLRANLLNHQTIRRAARNASAHYDLGNELYERMLDKRMIYSCAYWRDANDLDAAQEAKLDLICAKLGLEPGMRLLDIGCGWGGLAQFAAERYGARVTGISPAAQQVVVARRRCADLDVDIQQCDFRQVTGRYDRIVSVGMLEHVGPKNYGDFFDANDRLLAPDGLALHHTIGANINRVNTDPWFDRYIFPGGVVPSLEQLARATRGRWAIEDVHNFGPDYDRTLMAWYANIEAAWDEVPGYDDRFRRTWRYYLASSAAAFRVRELQLWQIVFTRTRRFSPVYRAVR
ncbi:MAG: cyclopropane fatty acyl phospholipid synthase [Acidimicrobiales bacterium]